MIKGEQEKPRPPMTFEDQADLLDYIVKGATTDQRGKVVLSFNAILDKAQLEDLKSTSNRLRLMSKHEKQIKRLVTGRR